MYEYMISLDKNGKFISLIELCHEDILTDKDIKIMLKTIYDDFKINKPGAIEMNMARYFIKDELVKRFNFIDKKKRHIFEYDEKEFI